ncbi:MAG: L,D-transpeptidase [Actinomycetota bacterium]
MQNSRSALRSVAVLAILMMIAVACGGGSEADPAAAGGSEAPTAISAIPTTAPIQFDDDSAPADGEDGAPLLTEDNFATPTPVVEAAASPYENIVLHVNDDVSLVPTFDAPNGSPTTIYDINTIDGRELEYPLYAETVFGNRLALRVEEYDSTGNWARVAVPVRPNGTTAWVQTAFFTEDRHDYHIVIDISDNLVNVYKGEELLREQLAVTGRESRPTPLVRSYIDEKINGASLGPAYGSWVLSIAAFSEALGTFGGGGMPKLALHGTNQPELMGQYVSSGCIRVPDDVIDFIAETVPVGATVDIVA